MFINFFFAEGFKYKKLLGCKRLSQTVEKCLGGLLEQNSMQKSKRYWNAKSRFLLKSKRVYFYFSNI